MDRRALLQASGGAVLALGLARFGGAPAYARQGSGLASLGLPELTITVTETGYQVSQQTLPAGWTLVTIDNQGPADNSADVMLLPPGETMESLFAALEEAMASPAATPPAWIYQATFAGAPWALAGASAQAIVWLPAGNWVVFSPAPLAPATLTVTGDNATPVAPAGLQADRELLLQEYAFLGLDDAVPTGPQVWQVTNIGQQPHLMTFSELPPGTTQAQFMDEIMAMMSGTPQASGPDTLAPSILGGFSTLSDDQPLYLALDLAAGTYGAVCFFPDPATGAPHMMLGMARVFTVS